MVKKKEEQEEVEILPFDNQEQLDEALSEYTMLQAQIKALEESKKELSARLLVHLDNAGMADYTSDDSQVSVSITETDKPSLDQSLLKMELVKFVGVDEIQTIWTKCTSHSKSRYVTVRAKSSRK